MIRDASVRKVGDMKQHWQFAERQLQISDRGDMDAKISTLPLNSPLLLYSGRQFLDKKKFPSMLKFTGRLPQRHWLIVG